MRSRTLGILALLTALVTAVWVAITIYSSATQPPIVSLADKLVAIRQLGALFYVNYLNAALITLLAVAFFAGLCLYCYRDHPLSAVVAAAFVPIYGFGNLVVYLAQVFIVPQLAAMREVPKGLDLAVIDLLLGSTLQDWPGSAAGALNLFSYAVLGIPSILLGVILLRKAPGLRVGGGLLALSGILSWIALLGVAFSNPLLTAATLVSGFLFLVALIGLGWFFLQPSVSEPASGALRKR